MWTQFWDMNSGGGQKEKWANVYIEAPEEEAKIIFYNRFGHNPERVSCTYCGDDYSISEGEDLADLTGFHRGCAYAYFNADGDEIPEGEGFVIGKGRPKGTTSRYVERPSTKYSSAEEYVSLKEYAEQEDVLIIRADEIQVEQRAGSLPEQGYVWRD